MKKILQLTFALILANVTITFGQTNSSILNGPINIYPPNGNWTSSLNFFDPTKAKQFHIIHDDAGRLTFGYDGSGKMTLLGNGNLGLGTYIPQSLFHVGNNTRFGIENGISIGGNTGVVNDFVSNFYTENVRNGVLHINTRKSGVSFGDVILSEYDGGNVGVGTTIPETKLHIQGDVTMGRAGGSKWYFQTPSSDLRIVGAVPANLSLLPQGNVGIGTINPLQTLDVKGAAIIGENNKYGLYTRVADGSAVQWFATKDNNTRFYNTKSSGLIEFRNSNDTWTNLSISDAGNIGIGTASPTNKLQIIADANNSGLTLTGLKSTVVNVQPGALRPIAVNDLGDVVLLGGAVGSGETWTKSGDNVHRSVGNVGIGTATPSAKLEVNGETIITGGVVGQGAKIYRDGALGGGVYGSVVGNTILQSTTGNVTFQTGIDAGERMRILANGNVGIGTTNSTYKLSVAGTIYSDNAMFDKELSLYGYGARVAAYGQNGDVSIAIKREVNSPSSWWIRTPNGSTDLDFFNGGTAMKITANGSVGIGVATMPTNYKLAVGGDIIAERVVVKLQTNWPDYVFTPSYHRASLPDVEKYINQNHHLPNIPSAQEVSDKGIDVGAMNTKFMEKIEELTLYLIEQNKKLEALEKKNAELENAIKNIKK